MIAAVGERSGDIRVWNVATGTEFSPRQGFDPRVCSLVFSPDSKTLASCLHDSTVLLWDLSLENFQAGVPPKKLALKDIQLIWADLKGEEDTFKAHVAIWTLVANPQKTVQFLKEHLQPVPEVKPQRIKRLLADLDSPDFAVREAASKELEQLGDVVEGALREALKNKPSAEVGRRVQAILDHPRLVRSPDALQRMRAIRVLELIGRPEARKILEVLAGGAPSARETHDAKAALERLARRIMKAP